MLMQNLWSSHGVDVRPKRAGVGDFDEGIRPGARDHGAAYEGEGAVLGSSCPALFGFAVVRKGGFGAAFRVAAERCTVGAGVAMARRGDPSKSQEAALEVEELGLVPMQRRVRVGGGGESRWLARRFPFLGGIRRRSGNRGHGRPCFFRHHLTA